LNDYEEVKNFDFENYSGMEKDSINESSIKEIQKYIYS